MKKENIIEDLRRCLPPLISRKEISKILGGVISNRTMSNLDSKGEGPEKVRFGKRTVAYSKEALLDWIEKRIDDFPDTT